MSEMIININEKTVTNFYPQIPFQTGHVMAQITPGEEELKAWHL